MADLEFRLSPTDNDRLANLCGQFDEHLKQIETRLSVEVSNRGELFRLSGDQKSVTSAQNLLVHLYAATSKETLSPERIHLYLQDAGMQALNDGEKGKKKTSDATRIVTRKSTITCRGDRQVSYVKSLSLIHI